MSVDLSGVGSPTPAWEPPLLAPTLTGQDKIISAQPRFSFPTPVRPGDLAARQKNAKTDAKRREGTGLRNALTGTNIGPAAPYLASPLAKPAGGATDPFGAIPQMQLPAAPAAEHNATFTPAQYHAPNKGLSYLAAALALLFPGAPIARAAAGFLGGMGEGAQNRYQREEKTAQDQYQVAQRNADTAHTNSLDAYNTGLQQAQVAYQNALEQRKARTDMAGRGLDWRTGKPFAYPSLPQLGAKGDYTSNMAAYGRLIQLAQRNGDAGGAERYNEMMTQYDAIAKQQMQDAYAWQKVIYQENQQNTREDYRQSREDARTSYREAAQNARAGTMSSTQLLNLQNSVISDRARFLTDFRNATSGLNATITDQNVVKSLGSSIRVIARSTDPEGMAQRLIDQTQDVNAQNLLQQAGSISARDRIAHGLTIVPLPPPPKSHTAIAPGIGAFVNAARASGLSPEQISAQLDAAKIPPAQKAQIRALLHLPAAAKPPTASLSDMAGLGNM